MNNWNQYEAFSNLFSGWYCRNTLIKRNKKKERAAEIEPENLKLKTQENKNAQRTKGNTAREKDFRLRRKHRYAVHWAPLEPVQHEKVWLALSFLIGKLSLRLRRRVGEARATGRNSISTEAAQFSRKFFMLSPNYLGVYPLNRPPPLPTRFSLTYGFSAY